MNCEAVRERLIVYLEDEPVLNAAERAEIEDHLKNCPDCRAQAEAFRGQIGLLREAGSWAAERGKRIEVRLPQGAPGRPVNGAARRRRKSSRSRRMPVGWLVAAAAGALLAFGAWKLAVDDPPTPKPPATLLEGQIIAGGEPVNLIENGRQYLVPPGQTANLRLEDGTLVWLTGESRFELPATGESASVIALDRGGLFCKTKSDGELEVRGSRIKAVASGRFALRAVARFAPPSVEARWTDRIFPRAFAAETGTPGTKGEPEVFLLVSGWAQVTVNGDSRRLDGHRALIGGDGLDPVDGLPETLLGLLQVESAELLAGHLSPRYTRMIDEFTARRLAYTERRGNVTLDDAARADLAWRIELMDQLIDAHQKRRAELKESEAPDLIRAERLAARLAALSAMMVDLGVAERRFPDFAGSDLRGLSPDRTGKSELGGKAQ